MNYVKNPDIVSIVRTSGPGIISASTTMHAETKTVLTGYILLN